MAGVSSLSRLAVVVFLSMLSATDSASSATLECGACMMIVAELEEGIRAVDPKKVVEAGSFRVNPNGEQVGLHKVNFARSNSHIVELLEGVCGKSSEYKHVVNSITGKMVYVNRKTTYLTGDDGKVMQSRLQGACNDLIDEHEETLEKFFEKQYDEPARELCTKRLSVCTSVDVSPLPPNDPPQEENEEGTPGEEGANDEL